MKKKSAVQLYRELNELISTPTATRKQIKYKSKKFFYRSGEEACIALGISIRKSPYN